MEKTTIEKMQVSLDIGKLNSCLKESKHVALHSMSPVKDQHYGVARGFTICVEGPIAYLRRFRQLITDAHLKIG